MPAKNPKGTLTLEDLRRLYKKAGSQPPRTVVYGDGFGVPLMYRGKEVKISGSPTGEVWFVNDKNFLIARVKDTEMVSPSFAYRVNIATWLSEIPIVGHFLSRLVIRPKPISWLDYNKTGA